MGCALAAKPLAMNSKGRNKMKIIKLFFLIIMVVLVNSCTENNPVDPYGITSEVYSISGNLNGWNLGSNKNVIFLGDGDIRNSDKVYSTSKIDSNGNFSLNNLDSPAEVMFMNPVYPRFSDDAIFIHNTLTCSDSSAKQVWGYLVITLANDTSLSNRGRIYRRNFNDWFYFSDDSVKPGDFIVDFIYADKDARLYGTIEYEYTDDNFNKKGHFTLDYNVNLKKGWNKEVTLVKFQEVSSDSGYTKIITTRSVTNYEPMGGRWDYSYYSN